MMAKYIKFIVMASFLFQQVVSHADAPGDFSEEQLDIKSLSSRERGVLKKMGIVRLERLNYQNELLGEVEKYIGYSSVDKNLLGFCVYSKYFFDDLSLAESAHHKNRYIGFDIKGCTGQKEGIFFTANSFPDATAYEIVSIFEAGKSKSNLSSSISFASEISLASEEKNVLLKRLSHSNLESISFNFIEELNVGCYLLIFYRGNDKVELFANFSSSIIKVIGIKEVK